MIKKKTIAIDMDNVIADVETHYIDWYEKDYGVRIPRESLKGVSELTAFPDPEAVKKFLYTPGFFRTVPVVKGAQEALKRLLTNFDIYIVSAAMEFPQSLIEKYQWMEEHFPFISWRNIILCGDKSIISTDYMIDDHTKNLDFCKGKPIIFTASHNVFIDRYTRINNWTEGIELLESEISI